MGKVQISFHSTLYLYITRFYTLNFIVHWSNTVQKQRLVMECFRPIPPYTYLQFHILCEHILFLRSFCVAFYFDNGEVLYHTRNRGRNRRVFFHRATPSRFAADPQQVRHCNSAHIMHTRNAYVCMSVCNSCLDYTTCHKCLIEFPAIFHPKIVCSMEK